MQTIRVTPRNVPSLTLTLFDEESKIETQFNALSILPFNNYIEIDLTPNTSNTIRIEEGKYYMLVLKTGNDIVLREKVFCTIQNPSTFSSGTNFISLPNPNNFISI